MATFRPPSRSRRRSRAGTVHRYAAADPAPGEQDGADRGRDRADGRPDDQASPLLPHLVHAPRVGSRPGEPARQAFFSMYPTHFPIPKYPLTPNYSGVVTFAINPALFY